MSGSADALEDWSARSTARATDNSSVNDQRAPPKLALSVPVTQTPVTRRGMVRGAFAAGPGGHSSTPWHGPDLSPHLNCPAVVDLPARRAHRGVPQASRAYLTTYRRGRCAET